MVKIRNYKDLDYEDVKHNLKEGRLYNSIYDTRENLKIKIKIDPDSILVAEVDNKVVGNVYIVYDGWSTFIFRLAVRKQYRNQGVGYMLLKEAENKLRQKEVKESSIFVDDNNYQLKEWYRKKGYIPTKSYRYMYKKLI